ncbi:MAG: Thermolysin, partial [Actinomycetia bacterium]|nr:Thermolysin [Actinomycetes bacterium]
MVPALALLCAAGGAVAVSPAGATPTPKPGRQPAGHSAFTANPFTADPPPATRKRAITNAQKVIATHSKQAHTASGHTFIARTVVVDKNGAADVRFDRTYKGLPVYGGDLVVHLKPDGTYKSLNPAAATAGAVSTKPSVTAGRAAAVSRTRLQGTIASVSKPRLAVKLAGRSAALVWETVVSGVLKDQTPSRLHVLVDARKGQVLDTRDEIQSFLPAGRTAAPQVALTGGTGNSIYSGSVPIDLTLSGGTYSMKDPSHGNGYTTNLNHATSGTGTTFSNTTGAFGNGTNSDAASAGVDAHYGAAETFDYYKNVQGRNGIFGNGAGVPSRTHYGNAYVNAFWDGTQMTYGDGSGNARPLVELDVAGHEMSH